ncbi:unnamed protein product [Malus baccata var. baccata]
MANLAKLDFAALDITGKNYLTWVLDTKIHLEAVNLEYTIREESSSYSQDRAKTIIFIRRHLDETLKSEYLTVEDLLPLWKALRNRCNHQTMNNELLMKNHNSQPTGSALFPEMNAASLERNTISSRGNNYKRGHGHTRGWWNGKGKNHGVQFHNQVPRHNPGLSFKNANRQKDKAHMNTPRNPEGVCHRCGGNGHWACTCRTSKHLVELYQASFKQKGVEINFFNQA